MSRSSFISLPNSENSWALHSTFLRHLFNLSPKSVSPSNAHFVKSLPHKSDIHLRNPVSQVWLFDANAAFCAFDADAPDSLAANAARCRRICSAKELSSPADSITESIMLSN